jgi:glycosyltransferase involved in cell wall biosynthesis
MRVCLVYDCLFPHTVGGAERWYRSLAERLVAAGHDVTYLTLRQWPRGSDPGLPGVRVVAVGPSMALYTGPRRRILPPLVFGAGVLWHLLRHGRRYDVVHTASFPYFSLLAAGAVRRAGRFALIVDWHEVWSAEYWRSYLGRAGGAVGLRVQRRCARLPQRAFCFSQLHARRLHGEGLRGEVTVLEGEYDGPLEGRAPRTASEEVVFAGRHIPEKRAGALVPAVARARERLPGLRARILGDGPERAAIVHAVAAGGLGDVISVPGFVSADVLDDALAGALAMVLPSLREGYGQVVVQASAVGTPSIVVSAPDNAAVELVEDGVNGVIARDADPDTLADAIVRVHAGGAALRASTAAWFAANAQRLSVGASLERVVEAYAGPTP